MNYADQLDSILETPVLSVTPGTGVAIKVLKDGYNQLIQHRNLRTYSTNETLHQCPRKFMLKKMQANAGTEARANNPTFAFGHSVGAGVAVYDQTQDLEQAVWAAFLAWDMDLLAYEDKEGARWGKSFAEAVWALYEYERFYRADTDLADYEVINVEATIAVDFEDGNFYSGHIDELLRHRETGRYKVKENKTSGFTVIAPEMYSNSDQALSYAVVIDLLGASEYSVIYTIYSTAEQRWVKFEFVKHTYQKLEWLQDQLLLNRHTNDYMDVDMFPKRGASCRAFNRTCEYYGSCDYDTKNTFRKRFKDLPALESLADIEVLEHIDYATTLSAITQHHQLENPK